MRSRADARLACAALALAATGARAETLTLAEALVRAAATSPALATARADVAAARGRLEQATVPFVANPVVTVDGARHAVGPDSYTDRGVMLGQEFEVGGQRGLRVAAARHDVGVAELRLADQERTLAATVRAAWVDLAAAGRRRTLAVDDQRLADRLLVVARQRAATGDAAALDVALARVDVGRAATAVTDADATLVRAQQALADAIGGTSPTPLVAADDEVVPGPPAPAPVLVARALEARPDLRAAREERARLEGEADLARREGVVPNVTVRGFWRHEIVNERIMGGELELPLPVWNRQQGSEAALRAQATGAGAEIVRLTNAIPREVESARTRLLAARASWMRVSSEVLPAAEEALRLLARSVDAGYVGTGDALTQQQRLLDARREGVTAWATLRQAEADLIAAVGSEDLGE